jgi:hypothetical protein
MPIDDDGKRALQVLQARVACKLAEVRCLLAPDLQPPYTSARLLAVAEERLAAMPPAQRQKLRLKALVAYAELEQMIAEMSNGIAQLSEELRAVRTRTQAINAYRRSPSAGTQYALTTF